MIPCALLGTGSALPPECIDNAALVERLGFSMSPEQVWEKTGIRTRHHVAPGTTSASLGAEALRRALHMANLEPSQLDRLIFISSSGGDDLSPGTASGVARELGVNTLDAFDVNNACGAFMTGLDLAARSVATGSGPVAVVCSEITSDVIDPATPRTSLIFGDAAAAAIIGPTDAATGIAGSFLRTDPSWGNTTFLKHPRWTGQRTWIRFAIGNQHMVDNAVMLLKTACDAALEDAGLNLDDIDWFAPHQPNGRMLDRILAELGIAEHRIARVCDRIGSTGGAAMPFGLDRIVRDRGLKEGDRVLLTGIGSGVSYGAIVLVVGSLGPH